MTIREQLIEFFHEVGINPYEVRAEFQDPTTQEVYNKSLSFLATIRLPSGMIKCSTDHLIFYFAYDGKTLVSVQPQMRYDVLKTLAIKREPLPLSTEQTQLINATHPSY